MRGGGARLCLRGGRDSPRWLSMSPIPAAARRWGVPARRYARWSTCWRRWRWPGWIMRRYTSTDRNSLPSTARRRSGMRASWRRARRRAVMPRRLCAFATRGGWRKAPADFSCILRRVTRCTRRCIFRTLLSITGWPAGTWTTRLCGGRCCAHGPTVWSAKCRRCWITGWPVAVRWTNAVVLTANGYLNAQVWPQEPAWHKVLDLAGDLALVGARITGQVLAVHGGHATHLGLGQAVTDGRQRPIKHFVYSCV